MEEGLATLKKKEEDISLDYSCAPVIYWTVTVQPKCTKWWQKYFQWPKGKKLSFPPWYWETHFCYDILISQLFAVSTVKSGKSKWVKVNNQEEMKLIIAVKLLHIDEVAQ